MLVLAASALSRAAFLSQRPAGTLSTIRLLRRDPSRTSAMAAADGRRLLYTEPIRDGDRDTGIRVMNLNRPDTLNSLTSDMAAAFTAALAELEQDHGKRVLIITGSGRAFSAGGDFGFIEDRIKGDREENAKILADFYSTFLAVRKLPIPTIAAVNGPAVGGGMGFAMACDMRLASSTAKFSYNFVKLGLSPGMASTALLPASTSYQAACRLLLTGDLVAAAEAKEMGLVLSVHEPEQLMGAAVELAKRIAGASPGAVSATLQMLRLQVPWEQLEKAAQMEASMQAGFFAGQDILEGLAAVREKRPPQFKSEACRQEEVPQ